MAEKHEFTVGIWRTDDYCGYGNLDSPFTWSEYQDTLEKARTTDGNTPVTIELSYIKQDCLQFLFGANDGTFIDTRDLLELNLLAQQLNELDAPMQDCFAAQKA